MYGDAGLAWAKLHASFIANGIIGEKQIPYYKRLMHEYPELKADCLRQINNISHEVEPRGHLKVPYGM